MVDTLITMDGTIKSRWYFAAGSPFPVGVDVSLEAATDEARIRFENWQTEERSFPARIGFVDPDSETINWIAVESFESKSADKKNTVAL